MLNSASAVKAASAVFIDVPNVARDTRNWQHAYKWERLSQAIARSEILTNTELMLANVYVKDNHHTITFENWSRVAFQTFGRTSFSMKVRWIDDIDSMIIEDMWHAVAQREQEVLAEHGNGQAFKMKVVLVSGDGDYARSIDKLRSAYGERLDLELFVYSWNDSLSEDLRTRALTTHALESVPGFERMPLEQRRQCA